MYQLINQLIDYLIDQHSFEAVTAHEDAAKAWLKKNKKVWKAFTK